jgi:hypothetical protein
MKYLRVVDQDGNDRDIETHFVPRIGERIVLSFGRGNEPVKDHYFRVRDVMYRLDNKTENQPAILVEEEDQPKLWPA